jgi:DNA-binding NtrC family response regulator
MNHQPITIRLVEEHRGDARLSREMLADVGRMRLVLVWSKQLGAALQHLTVDSFHGMLSDLSLLDSQGRETFDQVQACTAHMPIVVGGRSDA